MLKQCIQSLDHQSFVLSGQSEEIALLRAKMHQYEYLIDALRKSKGRYILFNITQHCETFHT